MNADNIVNSLLETGEDDIPVDYYLDKVNVGTVEEVLTSLGFEQYLKHSWQKLVPIPTKRFDLKFGESDPESVTYVKIYVGCISLPTKDNIHRDDTDSAEYKLDVRYNIENFYITSSRVCIGSKKTSLAHRLNHVIGFLIDAIKSAAARPHDDIYDFFNDIDKTWGKQPNRIVRRKPKSST